MNKNSIALAGLIFLLAAFFAARPIDDLHVFTEIRLGQLMLANLDIIRLDPFTWTLAGKEVLNPGPLAELIFAALHDAGSWRLLKAFHALTLALAFGLMVRAAVKGQAPSLRLYCAAALAVLLAAAVAASSSSLRPQGLGLLCFAVQLSVLYRGGPNYRQLPWLLLLGALWANAHTTLILGVINAGVFLAISLYRERRLALQASSRSARLLVLASGLFALQCFTPNGCAVFALTRTNYEISRHLLGISEWLHPWETAVLPAMAAFWLSLFLILALVPCFYKKLSAEDLGLALVYACLTLSSARLAFFFAAACFPLLFRLSACLLSGFRLEREPARGPVFALFLCGILFFTASVPLSPALAKDIPLKAVAALNTALPAGRVYNYREWGGILELWGSPTYKFLLDGRIYLFPPELWRRYEREAAGLVPLEQIEARARPDAFFLHKGYQAGLISRIKAAPQWELLLEGDEVVVFAGAAKVHAPPVQPR